jgi:hypothetical protein
VSTLPGSKSRAQGREERHKRKNPASRCAWERAVHIASLAFQHHRGRHARSRGYTIVEAAVEGAVPRLRAITMTMLVATLGLLPAALSHAIGCVAFKTQIFIQVAYERLSEQQHRRRYRA